MGAEVDGATAGAGGASGMPAQRAGWVLAIVIVTTVMTGLSEFMAACGTSEISAQRTL